MAGLTAQHWLIPNWDSQLTIAQLSLHHLTAQGLKAAVIDVDRTLLPGRDVTLPGPVRDWLVDAGRRLQLHLFSNNPSRERIAAVADQLQVSFTFGAGKPRRGALRSVVRDLALPPEAIAMIGDRLFTDVLCGNRMGLYTVLVRMVAGQAVLLSDDELDRVQPLIEAELEEREWPD